MAQNNKVERKAKNFEKSLVALAMINLRHSPKQLNVLPHEVVKRAFVANLERWVYADKFLLASVLIYLNLVWFFEPKLMLLGQQLHPKKDFLRQKRNFAVISKVQTKLSTVNRN